MGISSNIILVIANQCAHWCGNLLLKMGIPTGANALGMTIKLIYCKETKEEMKMATVTFRTDWCKGCGLCVDACPKGCLAIAADKINKKGYSPAVMEHPEKCIGCAFCATMCPDCIITVEK